MADKIPKFVLPDKLVYGKFIQVYVNGQPFFRAEADSDDSRHALMLSQLLFELGIQFDTFNEYEGRILKCPSKKGDGYELIGAGRIRELGGERGFMLTGDSATYYITPNQKHLDDLTNHIPKGIKLKIVGD